MKKRKLPESIDLSILEFLQYGDKERIAAEDRKAGYKTCSAYVGQICKGHHRNDRILLIAFDLALKRMGKFPMQAIKKAST